MVTKTSLTQDDEFCINDNYWCSDGHAELRIVAESASEAAELYVERGDWATNEDEPRTIWIDIQVWQGHVDKGREDAETHTVTIDPEPPACSDEHEHEWESPHELLGGLEENPGVWGSGGGVRCEWVCIHCGTYREVDSGAHRPDNGRTATVTSYRPADDDALRWVEAQAEARAAELVKAIAEDAVGLVIERTGGPQAPWGPYVAALRATVEHAQQMLREAIGEEAWIDEQD